MRELSDELNSLIERVIGAAIEVHRGLGPGYLEKVYEEALAVELSLRGIKFERQYSVAVVYKGHPCGGGKLDFLVEDALILELKTVDALGDIHRAQVISYFKVTNLDIGLLLNFQVSVMKEGIKRVICSSH